MTVKDFDIPFKKGLSTIFMGFFGVLIFIGGGALRNCHVIHRDHVVDLPFSFAKGSVFQTRL